MPLNVSETPLKELLDVLFVTLVVYFVLAWLRHTQAQLALFGAAVVGAACLLARQAGLVLTTWVLEGLLAVAVVLLVVAFQADLRRGLEGLALPAFGRRRALAPASAQEVLVRAALELASTRRGALIVLPGREPVERFLEGGIALDGELSEPLLLSLFDPHSPGHDGAAVVEGGRVTRFAAHLPLSADFAQLRNRGTRHAAALGLAECCDAFAVVVSEERGSVSVARASQLTELRAPTELARWIREYSGASAREGYRPRLRDSLRRSGREAILAAAISLFLWVALVPGSQVMETALHVPVVVRDLPPGFVLEKVDPEEVDITVSAPRRTLLFAAPDDFGLDVDAIFVQLGRRSFQVDPGDVKHPRGVTVVAVRPDRIQLTVRGPGAVPAAAETPALPAIETPHP
jgi:diadenylate cyclase